MGPSLANARLDKAQLEKLEQSTHYQRDEIKKLYKAFVEMAPKGYLCLEQFSSVYALFFPMAENSKEFASHIFRSFDWRSLGRMEFSDFLQAFSVMERGDEKEKLDWIFRVFDINSDGVITQDELRQIFSAIDQLVVVRERRTSTNSLSRRTTSSSPNKRASLISTSSSSKSSEITPRKRSSFDGSATDGNMQRLQLRRRDLEIEERAQAVFTEMDLNGDGFVDRYEFELKAKEDENIRAFLATGKRSIVH